jgi:phosphoribosylaminoimidazole (AIR) synthetase
MEHVFNLGLGMLTIVEAGDAHRALDTIRASGHDAWTVGDEPCILYDTGVAAYAKPPA